MCCYSYTRYAFIISVQWDLDIADSFGKFHASETSAGKSCTLVIKLHKEILKKILEKQLWKPVKCGRAT